MYRTEVMSILPIYDYDNDLYYLKRDSKKDYLHSIRECTYKVPQLRIYATKPTITSLSLPPLNVVDKERVGVDTSLRNYNNLYEPSPNARQLRSLRRSEDGETSLSQTSGVKLIRSFSVKSPKHINTKEHPDEFDKVPLLSNTPTEKSSYRHGKPSNQSVTDSVDSSLSGSEEITQIIDDPSDLESLSLEEVSLFDGLGSSQVSTSHSFEASERTSSGLRTPMVSYLPAGGSMQSGYNTKYSFLVVAHSLVAPIPLPEESASKTSSPTHKFFSYICIDQNSIVTVRRCRNCHIFMPPRSFHCRMCDWY